MRNNLESHVYTSIYHPEPFDFAQDRLRDGFLTILWRSFASLRMTYLRSTVGFVLTVFLIAIPSVAGARDVPKIQPPAAESERVAQQESKGKHSGGLAWDRFGPSWDHREDYSDRYLSEFVIVGGDYLGENWKNTYNIGAAYYFHFNDFLALGGQYLYSPIVVDKDTPFYQSLNTSDTHIGVGLVSFNTPAAWRAGSHLFNMDFYFTLGVGAMQINRQWQPTGVIGGGAKFFFPIPWLAFRLDINSYIHPTPMGGGRSELAGDVSMGGGISFLFPVRRIHPVASPQ